MSNLSDIRRERFKELFSELKEDQLSDEQIRVINELDNFIDEKRYGLVWEEHEENVDIEIRNKIPVFTEVIDNRIISDPVAPMNFLLEGDNLHSLYLLEKTHKNRVDIIYIDPPYNTNNSLTYNDDRVSKEDNFRHSKWISFMYKRLEVAKKLLSSQGVMFISIDDNEFAAMKLLLDSIFGENNFMLAMPRQTKRGGKSSDVFSKNHDYLLVYTNRDKDFFELEDHDDPGFKFEDKHVNERGKYKLNQTLDYDSLAYSPSLDYPININGETIYPGGNKKDYEKRKSGDYQRADWAWRWSKDLFEFGLKNDFIVLKNRRDGKGSRIYTKTYLNAKIERTSDNNFEIIYEQRKKSISSLELTNNMYSNDNAKKDLKRFELNDKFDYPKPVELVKKLITLHSNKNAIVLDFFAGSGTTAEATLRANLEDDGNRHFILCTNNENKIIDDVTLPRINKLLKGYETKGKREVILFEEKLTVTKLKNIDIIFEKMEEITELNKEGFSKISRRVDDNTIRLIGENATNTYIPGVLSNFKHYRTKFIPRFKNNDDNLSESLLKHIKEMIELDFNVDIEANTDIIFIFDEIEIDEFFDGGRENITLLIPNYVLLRGSQMKLIDERNINIVRIPDYYFSTELREAGEL